MDRASRGPGGRTGLRGRAEECALLDDLVSAIRRGESRSLLLRGEAGIGKTALLDYLIGSVPDMTVVRAVGVESEMEMAYASLHQLCGPLLDRLDGLPVPQRQAMEVVFGLSTGGAPDRFLVGLALLSLFAEAAESSPLLCVVDDAQWLDQVSALTLAFVVRRLLAEPVGIVLASREPGEELRHVPELQVQGVRNGDARALLNAAVRFKLDDRVQDRIIAATRGNPLALLELPRGMTPAELAGGFGLPGTFPVSRRIRESFQRQFDALPGQTRRLLQLAAADPVGDPVLIRRAAERLSIPADAATPAADAGLLEFGVRAHFRHPLLRSVAYRSASVREAQDAHQALAEVTDPQVDPDRRAWHKAHAAHGPDEGVAGELERSADRAKARGGLAAAAAFHERAAELTPEPARRAQRLLAAAGAKCDTGALDEALGLVVAAEGGPRDARQSAQVERLRGQIAFDQRRYRDAASLFLGAARHLESVDPDFARQAHLEALLTAMWGGGQRIPGELRTAGEAARTAPPGPDPSRAADLLLDGFALLLTDGYGAAASTLRRGLDAFLALNVGADEVGGSLWRAGSRAAGIAALELWDYESWHRLAVDQVVFARDTGALVHLQSALGFLGWTHVVAGELNAAALLFQESGFLAEATKYSPTAAAATVLVAWRGQDPAASRMIEATARDLTEAGLGSIVPTYARSVLYNGLGHFEAARDAARQAFERDPVGFGPLIVAELAEAASRTGEPALVSTALDWLAERTRVAPAAWALGIEARVRALLSEPDAAERLYLQSIEHLGGTRLRVEVARSQLLYGEWLRRENRRLKAREQLRTAHETFVTMGTEAFAERARRELLATGEKVRKRLDETRDDLTPQETQIARLACASLSNPEIGARLFLSPRTVEWHLRNVFVKLGVRSRRELAKALPEFHPELVPV